ncbi:MAG TPA: pitrilysin family protein [Candidatus Binatia bacterium]|nr:pitrilysin family protein [Candidatus Binatia bacterium]
MKDCEKGFRRLVNLLLALTIAVSATAPLFVSAQDASVAPSSQIERKNKSPVSTEMLRVRLPRPVEAKLPNGLTVLILEDHRLPSVVAQLHIQGAGALFEPDNLPGLAAATAQLLREGTPKRTSRQIAEELDRLGASVGAGSTFGATETVFTASGLSDNFDEWFAIALDIMLRPTFPAEELEQFKQRAKVQLRQQRAAPRFLAGERFNRAVFGNHPAAVVTATPESIDALTPEAMMQWHRQRYLPEGSVLAFAGDVNPSELLPKLTQWLTDWHGPSGKLAMPPHPMPPSTRRVYLVDRPNSVQTTLILGNIAIDRRSEDFVPMVVMNHLLGGGPASRLFLNLREEKGYTYGVYSSFTAREYPGAWSAGSDVRTEVTGGALDELFHEIRRIRESRVGEAELAATKRSVVARFALTLEQPTRLLGLALTRKLYDLPEDYWDRYPAKVAAVSADDLQRVARKYLNPEVLQIVAVGDARKIKPVLEKYGIVAVSDRDGMSLP